MARHDYPWHGALRVAAVYLGIAIIWIVFSDQAVQRLFDDPGTQAAVQTLKGAVFVLASAAVILVLVYRELKARRRVEERYRILVDQALAGIYVIRDGRFLFANPRLADIFGYDTADLTSTAAVADVVHPESRGDVRDNLRRRERGELDEMQYRFTGLRRDGSPVRLEVHGQRLNWDGEPAVMGILLDVTERERLEEELHRSKRLEALGRVSGAVVHDFNNFLTAIIAPMELCLAEMDPHDPGREELAEAKESALRAVDLTRKLLAFSRRRAYRTQRLDLNDLIRRLKPLLSRLCGDGVELRLELADGLPAAELDPNGVEQVLVNLVVNAREAQSGGRGTVWIRTRAGAGERQEEGGGGALVVLEVEDDGDGMSTATLQRAVEPFYTTKPNGSGLGLATVHGTVSQAGGEVAIESEPGEGTTFRIRLPAVDGPAEPLEPDSPEPTPLEHERLEGATVLVVDDDPAVRRVMVKVLEHHGLRTHVACSGGEALDVVREHGEAIDLVLTDLGLPDLDGIELVSQVERLIPDVGVLFVSGQSNEEVLERFAAERGRRFVEKPFSVPGLMREVAAALRPPAR